MMTENDLLTLKKEIDQTKDQFQQLKGQEKALLQQLKNDFDCENLEQANKKIKSFEKEIGKLSDEIEQGITELEENCFNETD